VNAEVSGGIVGVSSVFPLTSGATIMLSQAVSIGK
jgi:hypothetical protein